MITDIQAPSAIAEGQTLELSFTTDETASYRILEDGSEVSTTNTYSVLLDYDSAGLYIYTFEASNANGTVNDTRTVEVLDTPLSFDLREPQESDQTTNIILFDLITNIEADVCYTVSDAGTHTLDKWNATHHNGTLTLLDGVHVVSVKCNRNGELAVENVTLKVDTTAPGMAITPSGTVHDQAILKVVTTEASTCRYDTTYASYNQLGESFSQSNTLIHEEELDITEGTYTYYVACKDVYGNIASTDSRTFTLQIRPSAEIEIEGENPRKTGNYVLTLKVSEALQSLPTLALKYQGETETAIPLTEKDTTTYEGIVIVDENEGEKVGSFRFEGRDLDGLVGTRIEEGELFVIDTIKPVKVETFNAVNGTGGVNLSWYFDAEDEVHYNLYRSLELGVDYTHYYDTTSGDSYHDRDTEHAVRYYYRIAAVDKAGNVGPLSDEEWASPAKAVYAATGGGAILSPVLQVALDERVRALDIDILDAERAVSDLRAEQDKERSWLIATLDLASKANTALRSLQTARESLESFRTLDLTEEEFNTRVTSVQKTINDARAALPLRVELLNQAEYDETASESSLETAVNHALQGKTIAEKERADYIDAAHQLDVRVTTLVSHAEVRYANTVEQSYTIVEKHLLSGTPQSNVIAIEIIPKAFAQRASDIDFLGTQPIVLEEDPVVQYTYDSLTDETIRYAVKGIVGVPDVRQSALVVLPKPGASLDVVPLEQAEGEAITGAVSLFGMSSGQGMIIFLGIIIIVGLLVYYFRLQSEPAPGPIQQPVQPMAVQGVTVAAPSQKPVTKTVLVQRMNEPLVGLLLRGHTLIDDTKYLDALYFYKAALNRYGQEEWPSERLQNSVKDELGHLHAKLSLFDCMSKAHDAIVLEDKEQLTASMEAMREHAMRVGDGESRLLDKAKVDYDYFYNQLNRIQAEGLRVKPEN